MATLQPAALHTVTELSDDEGCHLAAGTGNQNLDNSRVSALYLRNHGDEIHEALDVRTNPTTYSDERKQLDVLTVPPNVKAALEWYGKDNQGLKFDVLNCSWDDLFAQMARAQGDHEARVAHKGNWFKYLWRKAGTQKEAIEPWLQLIPDDYGLCFFRGAIAIVFHIAEKAHEREKELLKGFEEITDTIQTAKSKGVSFLREPEMHACCQALYDCLVGGIADLIWSLKPEVEGKNFIEKFKNKQEKKKSINVSSLLKKVQKLSTELDQCAERILAKKAIETHIGVGIVQIQVEAQQSTLSDIKTDQSVLLAMTQQSSSDVKTLGRNIVQMGCLADTALKRIEGRIDEKTDELLDRLSYMNMDQEQVLASKSAQNGVKDLLADSQLFHRLTIEMQDMRASFKEENEQLRRDIRSSLTPVPRDSMDLVMKPVDFIEDLIVPLKLVNDDQRACFLHSSDFSDINLEQAQSLLATDKFNRWMASKRSEVLLVDGNDDSTMRQVITPMSVLCATLAGAIEKAYGRGNVIILKFWCNMHTNRSDDTRGPIGMLRAILVQLAAALVNRDNYQLFNFGDLADQKRFLADFENHRFTALRLAFKTLLTIVPENMPVFVIIDGVSAFEDSRYCDDLHDVVDMFDRFVEEDRRLLKVLYTCPFRNMTLVRKKLVLRSDHMVLQDGGRDGQRYISEQSVLSRISRDQSHR